MAEQRFCVEYAKRGTAGCKKCKDKIVKGLVRIGKIVPNPFSESAGEMKEWYHVKCIFEKLERARATTKKIEDITDLEGWEELQDEDKELINKHVSGKKELLFYTRPRVCMSCMYVFFVLKHSHFTLWAYLRMFFLVDLGVLGQEKQADKALIVQDKDTGNV